MTVENIPGMQQYLDIKKTIRMPFALFRMGDFTNYFMKMQ